MIGIDKLIYSIGGSIITLLITSLIKQIEKRENLKKQTKIFIQFIDEIILKYLLISIAQYNDLLNDINNEKLFDARVMTQSPMLNKGIFDFFDKSDLIKILSYCKQNSLVDVYHNFYEIDFLQANSPSNILDTYLSKILNHYEEHKKENETLHEHNSTCQYFKQQKQNFKEEIIMQRDHSKNLIKSFLEIKSELKSIDELNYE